MLGPGLVGTESDPRRAVLRRDDGTTKNTSVVWDPVTGPADARDKPQLLRTAWSRSSTSRSRWHLLRRRFRFPSSPNPSETARRPRSTSWIAGRTARRRVGSVVETIERTGHCGMQLGELRDRLLLPGDVLAQCWPQPGLHSGAGVVLPRVQHRLDLWQRQFQAFRGGDERQPLLCSFVVDAVPVGGLGPPAAAPRFRGSAASSAAPRRRGELRDQISRASTSLVFVLT